MAVDIVAYSSAAVAVAAVAAVRIAYRLVSVASDLHNHHAVVVLGNRHIAGILAVLLDGRSSGS